MEDPLTIEWYYKDGGDRLGPVAEPVLKKLLASGSLSASTLVWHPGLTDWMPAKNVFLPQESSPVICSECGQILAVTRRSDLDDVNVCDRCKPLSLRECTVSPLFGAP